MIKPLQAKIVELNRHGYYIGPRDPDRNSAFGGAFMVCHAEVLDMAPSEDAADTGFCIVGDDLTELVEDAYNNYLG